MILQHIFYRQPVTITCPLCRQDMEVTFQDIAEEGVTITCIHCEDYFYISHEPGTREKIRQIQKALSAFSQEFSKKE